MSSLGVQLVGNLTPRAVVVVVPPNNNLEPDETTGIDVSRFSVTRVRGQHAPVAHCYAGLGDRHLSVMAVALSACWLGVRRFLLCIEAFDVVPHSSHRRPAPSSHRSPYLALLLALLSPPSRLRRGSSLRQARQRLLLAQHAALTPRRRSLRGGWGAATAEDRKAWASMLSRPSSLPGRSKGRCRAGKCAAMSEA